MGSSANSDNYPQENALRDESAESIPTDKSDYSGDTQTEEIKAQDVHLSGSDEAVSEMDAQEVPRSSYVTEDVNMLLPTPQSVQDFDFSQSSSTQRAKDTRLEKIFRYWLKK